MSALTRARGWMFDLLAHHHAENLRISREAQRKTLGLSSQDLPYPGTVTGNTINIHEAPQVTLPPAASPPAKKVGYQAVYYRVLPDGTEQVVRRQRLL